MPRVSESSFGKIEVFLAPMYLPLYLLSPVTPINNLAMRNNTTFQRYFVRVHTIKASRKVPNEHRTLLLPAPVRRQPKEDSNVVNRE